MEVQATPFDFVTGQLKAEHDENWIKAAWPNVDYYESSNYETLFKNELTTPDNPLHTPTNAINPKDRYAIFVESDLKKDAGQSTVPFFDAQPVEMEQSLALDGIGLARKGDNNGGGFLTLKLFTIDISQYMI